MAAGLTWYRVAVYINGADLPIRSFPGYATEQQAETAAEILRSQCARNGWTHAIRVESVKGGS
jgi:hypothetical protein